ncbi:T9SS type A sorting domain-containing protein [Taibaiella chishuiensis]|uniref:Putative secreted protein (Por secretion system target) n=1 Tax=Taibaiella chishuiensis TaxID=1434707 RepID=A0A2P8D6E1_9BACT|nr:T9SS type A sorting domain-containing protein [Taibaiella chishuiensis]PSK92782.1 putative secreted protein (Por secretion system target) [Taibaiella chishuiensis]
MNKKTLLLAACILPLMTQAQRPQYDLPLRTLTIEEIFAGKYLDLYSSPPNPTEGRKPTVIQQRMIASANRKGSGSATPQLQDSTLYVYSGTRGASPVRATYNVQTVAEFDTAFIYIRSDNFATAYPRYGQHFNSNNGLVNSKLYTTTAQVQMEQGLDYYPANTIKTGRSLAGDINTPNWRYREVTLSETGKITRDSAAEMNTGSFSYATTVTQWGAGDRVETNNATTKDMSTGIRRETRTYFFYDNATATNAVNDSTTSLTISGSATSTTIVTGAYTYNTAGKIAEYATFNEPGHQPASKSSYTYNTSGQMISSLSQMYDQVSGAWKNASRVDYGYTQTANTYYLSSIWDEAANNWKEIARSIIVLNPNGLPDSMKNYYMGALNSLYTYAYDAHKNRTRYAEYLISTSGNIATADVYNYYYEDYEDGKTGISDLAKNNLDILVYPNPAGNTLHYRVQTGQPTNSLQCRIYDASGRLVQVAASSKKEDAIDVSRLHTGIYFLEIKDREQHLAHRQSFIKQ